MQSEHLSVNVLTVHSRYRFSVHLTHFVHVRVCLNIPCLIMLFFDRIKDVTYVQHAHMWILNFFSPPEKLYVLIDLDYVLFLQHPVSHSGLSCCT